MADSRADLRKKLLKVLAEETYASYDGIEGFLGESFCEDRLKMCRTDKGTPDIDGHICIDGHTGRKSVQVKFKWGNQHNWRSRYISISAKAVFDLLVVTYASPGDNDVRLFGVWEKSKIQHEILNSLRTNKVSFPRLIGLEQFKIRGCNSTPFPWEGRGNP